MQDPFPISVLSLPDANPVGHNANKAHDPSFDEDTREVLELEGMTSDEIDRLSQTNPDAPAIRARQLMSEKIPSAGSVIDEGLEMNLSGRHIATNIYDKVEKAQKVTEIRPNADSLYVALDKHTKARDLNWTSNRSMFERKLKTRMAEKGYNDQGWISTGWDFMDYYMLRSPGTNYEDITDRTGRLGLSLSQMADLPPAEAEKAMDEYLEGIEAEGVATSNNRFAWQQAMREFDSLGYNYAADDDLVLGVGGAVLDIASLGASSAVRSVARQSASKFSRRANAQGPKAAGDMIETAVENSNDATAIVEGGTDLINPSRSVEISGPNNPVISGTPTQAANDPSFVPNLRDRLSKYKVSEVEEAVNKIPPSVLNEGISEDNIDLIEDIIRNPDWTVDQALYVHEGRVPRTSFRDRLSRFTLEDLQVAGTKIKGLNPEDGLSGENLRLIENYFGHNLPTEGELNKFFGRRTVRTDVGGVTSVGGGVSTFRGVATASANSVKPPKVMNLPTAPTGMPTGTTVINRGKVAVAVPPPSASVPAVPTAARALTRKTLLESIEEVVKKGYAGRAIDEDAIKGRAADLVSKYTQRTSHPVFNTRIANGIFHNKSVVVEFGTPSGAPFNTPQAAQTWLDNLADKEMKARGIVAQVDGANPDAGYVVHFEHQMRQMSDVLSDGTVRGAPAIDISRDLHGIQHLIARGLASSVATDDARNAVRAQLGEAAGTNFRAYAMELGKVINKIDANAEWTINQILRDLRDGPDADIKDYYDEAEFSQKFMAKHPDRRLPNQKEIDAYNAVISIDEADWFMSADNLMQKFVNAGFETISFSDSRQLAKKASVQKLEPSDTVMFVDPRSGISHHVNHADIQSTDSLWELAMPFGTTNPVRFILNPSSVGPVRHGDVLGRNAGGRRTYKGNYFVTVESPDGVIAAKVVAQTQKQADLARDQLGKILEEARTGSTNMDEVVRANNAWNPSIDSYTAFSKWAADNDVDLRGAVSSKANRGRVESQLTAKSGFIPVPELTWGERLAIANSRSNRPLQEFGGGTAFTEDPLTSIGKHYAQSANAVANQAAIRQGIDSWVRQVIELGSERSGYVIPPDVLNTGDFTAMYLAAQEVGQNTSQTRRLKELKTIIESRHNIAQSESIDSWLSAKTVELGEWVLDSKFGNSKPLQFIGGKIIENDSPMNLLLKMGFGAVFGFANLSQFAMQASHGILMIPFISHSAAGTKALFLTPAFRAYLASEGTKTGRLLKERVIKELGVDEGTFVQLIEFMKLSGRSIVGNEVLELGTVNAGGITRKSWGGMPPSARNKAVQAMSKGVGKAYDASFFAYRAGEQYSRTASLTTAFFEYKSKFPTGNPLSDEGIAWITRRDHTLSFNMTNSARATFQQGLGRFPTQWLSYPFRAMESIFIGKNLTPRERAMTAFAAIPLWGSAGLGMDHYTDAMSERFGLTPDDPFYTAMRDGLVDGLLDGVGLDISVTDRLSPIKGILDLVRDSGDQSLMETLAGPSGTIIGGGAAALWNTLGNFAAGKPEFATEDFLRTLRTVSTADYLTKAAQIYQYGYMRSKTGYLYEADFDAIDAAIVAAGFSPQQVHEINSARTLTFRLDAELGDFRKSLQPRMASVHEAIRLEDYEAAKGMLTDMELEIELSGFSLFHKQNLRKSLLNAQDSNVQRMITDLIKAGRRTRADALEQRTN